MSARWTWGSVGVVSLLVLVRCGTDGGGGLTQLGQRDNGNGTGFQVDVAGVETVSPDVPAVEPDSGVAEDVPAEDVPDTSPVEGPALTALPGQVHFGSTTPGVEKTQEFSLRNDGTVNLNIISADLQTGPESGFIYVAGSNTPAGLVVPGEKQTFKLAFTSEKGGSHISSIVVETQPALAKPLVISLKAVVSLGPSSVVSEITGPASLKFGSVLVGSKKNLEFDITNDGTEPVQILSLAMEATSSKDFSFAPDQTPPMILGASSKLHVVATYTPDKPGPDGGVLTVENSSVNTPTFKISMTGSGYTGPCSGQLTCQPSLMKFGKVPLGQPKAMTLVCKNTGFGEILVKGVDIQLGGADGFTFVAPPAPTLLAGGQGIAVPVLFTPKDLTERTGKIVVTSDDCATPTQTAAVSAQGDTPPVPPPCLPAGKFEPKVQWEWKSADGDPAVKEFGQVFMSPIVVNLDDDDGDGDVDGQDIPEVLFSTHKGGFPSLNDDVPAVLRAIHGKDGSHMWSVVAEKYRVTYGGGLAAAELDGLPGPEIVAIAYEKSGPGQNCPGLPAGLPLTICGKYMKGHLIAFHGKDGSLFWESEPYTGSVWDTEQMGAPSIADLDGDGIPEITLGNTVWSGLDGTIKWVGKLGRGQDGHGHLSIVADVDLDGKPEVIAGNTAYKADGTVLWSANVGDTHGTAAADFDLNGTIEVFIHGGAGGQAVIVDGKTGSVQKGPVDVGYDGCCIATPAVADLDKNNPGLELVTAADKLLKAFDKNLQLLWTVPVQEETGAAGPSAFDVEGDGVAEVVYADEGSVYVIRGSDGTIIFQAPRSSRTGLDQPVIADIDGDNHAEIVVSLESFGNGPAIRAFSNSDDSWVATRRIWNQHAYSIVNVFDNATIPPLGMAQGLGPLVWRTNLPTCK